MTYRGMSVSSPQGPSQEVRNLIDKLATQFSNMDPFQTPLYGSYEFAGRAQTWRRNAAETAHSLLMEIIGSPKDTPLRTTAIEFFNGSFMPKSIKNPVVGEDLLSMMNAHNFQPFIGTRRMGPRIDDLIVLDEKTPLYEGAPPPLPAGFSAAPIAPRTDIALEGLAHLIEGKALVDHAEGLNEYDAFDANALGAHPRMSMALQAIVGALMAQTGKSVHELRALEFAPRMIIGGMTLLARMGLDVTWKGTTVLRDFHTRQQLARLPQHLQERISYTEGSTPVDLAVVNNPLRGPLFSFMTDNVARGGFLMAETSETFTPEDTTGWQLTASVPFPVMPQMMARPLSATTLRIWQKMV